MPGTRRCRPRLRLGDLSAEGWLLGPNQAIAGTRLHQAAPPAVHRQFRRYHLRQEEEEEEEITAQDPLGAMISANQTPSEPTFWARQSVLGGEGRSMRTDDSVDFRAYVLSRWDHLLRDGVLANRRPPGGGRPHPYHVGEGLRRLGASERQSCPAPRRRSPPAQGAQTAACPARGRRGAAIPRLTPLTADSGAASRLRAQLGALAVSNRPTFRTGFDAGRAAPDATRRSAQRRCSADPASSAPYWAMAARWRTTAGGSRSPSW